MKKPTERRDKYCAYLPSNLLTPLFPTPCCFITWLDSITDSACKLSCTLHSFIHTPFRFNSSRRQQPLVEHIAMAGWLNRSMLERQRRQRYKWAFLKLQQLVMAQAGDEEKLYLWFTVEPCNTRYLAICYCVLYSAINHLNTFTLHFFSLVLPIARY